MKRIQAHAGTEPVDSHEQQLWKTYWESRSVDARNALAMHYLPLVRKIANAVLNALPRHAMCEFDDLVSRGFEGLVHAIETFDPARGTRFSTASHLRIRGAMQDGLREQDWVPRLERKKLRASGASAVAMYSLAVREDARGDREGMEGDVNPGPLCDSRAADPQASADFLDSLRWVTKGLRKKARVMVILYYVEGMTIREIASHFGLSVSRVSQMHMAFLKTLEERKNDPGHPRFRMCFERGPTRTDAAGPRVSVVRSRLPAEVPAGRANGRRELLESRVREFAERGGVMTQPAATLTISSHDICRITLRQRGVDAIREHYFRIGLRPPRVNPGDPFTGPLWEIMQIFGSKCFGCGNPPFDTTLQVEVPMTAIKKAKAR